MAAMAGLDALAPPRAGADWVGLTRAEILIDALAAWATEPGAGAVVTFSGVVRDHAEGRDGVVALTYEAYEGPAEEAMAAVVAAARDRWPEVCRVAMVHRVGRLGLSETSVAVAVSAPHRREAFEAARFCIDTLKTSVPIWKQEHWRGGDGWAVDARPLEPAPAESKGDA
jgi:molybdopterin synthase catalytic subunit